MLSEYHRVAMLLTLSSQRHDENCHQTTTSTSFPFVRERPAKEQTSPPANFQDVSEPGQREIALEYRSQQDALRETSKFNQAVGLSCSKASFNRELQMRANNGAS